MKFFPEKKYYYSNIAMLLFFRGRQRGRDGSGLLPPLFRPGEAEGVPGAHRHPGQGRKLMSCSHCQELSQHASLMLLIGCIRVNNQSEARTAS